MATVEFVIILPVLLLVLFAIVEFGILFGRWQTLSNAAREGARTAIVFRTNCDVATVETEVRTVVKNYASALGIVLQDTDIAVTGACGLTGTQSDVQVDWPYAFRVVPGFSGVNPTINLVGKSVMRNEGTS
ncbi:MAG: TadE/TadG family type IV pilus assembly protein [Myxococcota bacterium]